MRAVCCYNGDMIKLSTAGRAQDSLVRVKTGNIESHESHRVQQRGRERERREKMKKSNDQEGEL